MISIFDMTSGEFTHSSAPEGQDAACAPLFDEHEFRSELRLEPVNSYWSETRRGQSLAIIASLPIEALMRNR